MKFFSLLYQGDIHFASDQKVIPAEEFGTILSAQEILDKAHHDAAAYKQQIEKECKELKKEAE